MRRRCRIPRRPGPDTGPDRPCAVSETAIPAILALALPAPVTPAGPYPEKSQPQPLLETQARTQPLSESESLILPQDIGAPGSYSRQAIAVAPSSYRKRIPAAVLHKTGGIYGVQCPVCKDMVESPFHDGYMWAIWEVIVRKFVNCGECGTRMGIFATSYVIGSDENDD